MKISELSTKQREKLCTYKYDWSVEKHEGPWNWSATLKYQNPEFFSTGKYDVLFPLGKTSHPNIIILRCIPSQDNEVLTIFLEDTTYYSGIDAGFLAICERVAGENWYVTTLYHEWYLLEYTGKTRDDILMSEL